MVIRKINEIVPDNEDYIILNGIISCGGTIETLELLSKIKAKIIFQTKDEEFLLNRDKWKEISSLICETDGSQKAIINEKESKIVLPASKKNINAFLGKPNVYLAAAESIISQEDLYKRPVLNISLNKWNFEPIELGERIPQIIDDFELFNSMENNKEE
jgi:hypothetical protein